MRRFVVFVFLAALCVSAAIGGDEGPPKETKRDKALKVLNISGAVHSYVEALLEGVRQSPIASDDKELYARFATAESVTEYFIPVYMESYTDEELDAMINFYSTPIGQSIVKKSLPVVRELRKASMQWGMTVSAKVNTEKARLAAEKDK